jgi:hypothetical protein
MSYFLRNGDTFSVTNEANMDLYQHLPVGTYIIKQDQWGNLQLQRIDSFTPPSKLYGETTRRSSRIIQTFLDREASTGVMLNGEKGSGKTLLAKMLSINLALQEVPTIVINSPWCGDKFNSLVQSIDQPCMILFDEFEKVYDSDQQESILTLLDGVFPSKKLFVLTCNDKWRVDRHMRNRPGRIFYMLDFKGLEETFIREYCQDTLVNKKHINGVCNIAAMFADFNFDMLKALVEEMNRYNESPQEAILMLNAKPEFGENKEYTVKLIVDGKPVKPYHEIWEGNPLQRNVVVEYTTGEDEDWTTIKLDVDCLKKVDSETGSFTFSQNGNVVILTKKATKDFDWKAF